MGIGLCLNQGNKGEKQYGKDVMFFHGRMGWNWAVSLWNVTNLIFLSEIVCNCAESLMVPRNIRLGFFTVSQAGRMVSNATY